MLALNHTEMPFNTFANREDPDLAALVRAAWSGSTPEMPTITIFAESYRFSVSISALRFRTSKYGK